MPNWLNGIVTPSNVAIAVLIGLVLGWDKVKSLVSSLRVPSVKAVNKNKKNVEAEDTRCISYLRDRASEVGDEGLLQEIKSVANQFFDIHANIGDHNTK